MSTYALLPNPKFRAFDANGDPLAGGKVYTYEPGTTTPKASYTDNTGATPNANPVILDANGEASIWLNGLYKVTLKNSAGVEQWTVDNVSAMPAESSTVFSEWLSNGLTPTYIAATQFSVPGDETSRFHVGRRIKATVTAGTVYGVISASSYAASVTTVTVLLDSGNLDAGISVVYEAVLSALNHTLPKRTYTISDATALTHAVTAGQVQNGSLLYATVSGTNTYTATLTPAPSAYVAGMKFVLSFTNANTSATPTLNLNGLGAKTIKRPGGQSLFTGDIQAGWIGMVEYNGTDMILLNPAAHDHSEVLQGGGLAANTVDTSQLVDLAVTTSKIEDSNVTSTKIATASVGVGKLIFTQGSYAFASGKTIGTYIINLSSAYAHAPYIYINSTIDGVVEMDYRTNVHSNSGTYIECSLVVSVANITSGNGSILWYYHSN